MVERRELLYKSKKGYILEKITTHRYQYLDLYPFGSKYSRTSFIRTFFSGPNFFMTIN